MTFRDRALPLIKLGIPVFPLLPKVKEPPAGMTFLEEASTDPNKIEQWNLDNEDYNVAMLADGEYCFLEFDIPNGIEQACAETHQPRPVTREQLSGNKGQHFIFRTNDSTKALGNRSVSLRNPCLCDTREQQAKPCVICTEVRPHHHHEWFSLRSRNKYLVGAGSIHPNGNQYICVQDIAPVEMPEWLCEWIREHSSPSKIKGTKPKNVRCIHEDFDPCEFWDHYDIHIDFIKDGVWHVVSECPGVGRKHRGSKLTAFYWDGESFGWSCFAQACPTSEMSIGQLIKFLNKEHEPYVGPIWEDEIDFTTFDIDLGFDIDQAEVVPLIEDEETEQDPNEHDETLEPAQRVEPVAEKPKLTLIIKDDNDDEETLFIGVRASDIKPKIFRWLWPDKIPEALTLWTGKPDCTKTLSLLDLASRVSRGAAWPDGSNNEFGPRIVLYCATEDSKEATLVPRLMAAGANMQNIVFPLCSHVQEKTGKKEKYERKINLRNDLKLLKKAVEKRPEIGLIIFDPLNSYWDGIDENKSKEVAPVLEAIAKFCEDTRVTVIGLIHHSKRGDTDALGKVLGSVRVGGIARAVWEISKDKEKKPDEEGAIRMALAKGNVHRKRSGMTYHVEGVKLVIDGKEAELPRVVWDDELDKSADDLLDEQRDEANETPKDRKINMAISLIRSSLPMTPPELTKKFEAEGIAVATMYRAKDKINESDDPIYSEPINGNKRERRWWLTSQWKKRMVQSNNEAQIPDVDVM